MEEHNEIETPAHDFLQSLLMNKGNLRRIFPQLKNIPDDNIVIRVEVPILKQYEGYQYGAAPTGKTIDIVGYWDIEIKWGEFERRYIYIEIKPQILSLGNIIRQIKKYWVYQPGDYQTCLFTWDLKYKNEIESQGITVIDAHEFDKEYYRDFVGA